MGRDRRWTHETGLAVVITFAVLAIGHGKAYYGGPVYPLLFAAGATAVAAVASPTRRRIAFGLAGTLIARNLAELPLGRPFLPPEPMSRYAHARGLGTETNYGTHLPLP